MRIARSVVSSTSFLFWPTVLAVSIGVTFHAPLLYAEAGPAPPPACTDEPFEKCADAGEGQICSDTEYSIARCRPDVCLPSSEQGGMVQSLSCSDGLNKCAYYDTIVEPCRGKAIGDSCVVNFFYGGTRACAKLDSNRDDCVVKTDAGTYEHFTPTACLPVYPTSGGNGSDSGSSSSGSDAGANPEAPTRGDASSGSGCSLSGTSKSESVLFTIPLGLGLAFTFFRRARRRRAVERN